jgi:hypothetical protein
LQRWDNLTNGFSFTVRRPFSPDKWNVPENGCIIWQMFRPSIAMLSRRRVIRDRGSGRGGGRVCIISRITAVIHGGDGVWRLLPSGCIPDC